MPARPPWRRTTVYVTIGNSDDKLTQEEWADYQSATNELVDEHADRIHGRWASLPTDPWQNACWCLEVEDGHADDLRRHLTTTAGDYQQDSIAWAIAQTEFLTPGRTDGAP
jgi:hypothetical protein